MIRLDNHLSTELERDETSRSVVLFKQSGQPDVRRHYNRRTGKCISER